MKQIWPELDHSKHINRMCSANIFQDSNNQGKAVVQIECVDDKGMPIEIYFTQNQLELLSGIAIGARKRWEDFQK